jgi:hypothetical protein
MSAPLFQPPITEDHVIMELIQRFAYARIPVRRVKERIPEMRNGRKHWRGRGLGSSGSSDPGIPDLIGHIPQYLRKDGVVVPARPLYIEVKRPKGGRIRPAQLDWIQSATLHGCLAFFATSWDDCVQAFASVGYPLPNPK